MRQYATACKPEASEERLFRLDATMSPQAQGKYPNKAVAVVEPLRCPRNVSTQRIPLSA